MAGTARAPQLAQARVKCPHCKETIETANRGYTAHHTQVHSDLPCHRQNIEVIDLTTPPVSPRAGSPPAAQEPAAEGCAECAKVLGRCAPCLYKQHIKMGTRIPAWLEIWLHENRPCGHIDCDRDLCWEAGFDKIDAQVDAANAQLDAVERAQAAAGAPPRAPLKLALPEGLRRAIYGVAPRRALAIAAAHKAAGPNIVKLPRKRKPVHHDFLRRSLRKPSHVTSTARPAGGHHRY